MLPSASSRNLGKLAPDPFHVDAVPCMSTLHTKSFKMAAGLHTGVRHLSTSDVLELHRTPMLYGVKRAHGLGQNLLVALRGGGLHRPSRADTYHSTHAAKPEGQSNLPHANSSGLDFIAAWNLEPACPWIARCVTKILNIDSHTLLLLGQIHG